MDSKYSAIKPSASIASTIHNFLLKRKKDNSASASNGPNAKQQKLQTVTRNDQSPGATSSSPVTSNGVNGSIRPQSHGSMLEQRRQLPVFGVKIP